MPMPIKAVIGAIASLKTPKALKEALKKKYAKQIAQYKGNNVSKVSKNPKDKEEAVRWHIAKLVQTDKSDKQILKILYDQWARPQYGFTKLNIKKIYEDETMPIATNPSKEVDWYKYWTHVQPKLRSEILNFIKDLENEGRSKKRIEIELIDTYDLDSQFVKWLLKYTYKLKL